MGAKLSSIESVVADCPGLDPEVTAHFRNIRVKHVEYFLNRLAMSVESSSGQFIPNTKEDVTSSAIVLPGRFQKDRFRNITWKQFYSILMEIKRFNELEQVERLSP